VPATPETDGVGDAGCDLFEGADGEEECVVFGCAVGALLLLGAFLLQCATLPALGHVALRLMFSVMWLRPLLIYADGGDGVFFALLLPVVFSFLPSLMQCFRIPRPILATALFIFIASTHTAHAMPIVDDGDGGGGDEAVAVATAVTALAAGAGVCLRAGKRVLAATFVAPNTAEEEDAAAEDAAAEDLCCGILDGDAAAAFADGDVPNIDQEVFDEHRSKAAVSGKGTTQTYSYTVKVRSTCHVYLVLSVYRVRS
jgi:hypothetical protein